MEQLKLVSIEPWWVQCIGLFGDGTVRKIYLEPSDQCYRYSYKLGENLGWRNVKSISSSRSHLAGLTFDGKVLLECGTYHFYGVDEWKDVIGISAGYEIIAGLIANGSIIYTLNGSRESYHINSNSFRIIATNARTVFGIDSEGTLFQIRNGETQILNKDCNNVIQLEVVSGGVYGLTAEGHVKVIYGEEDNTNNWSYITRIVSGNNHLLGLTEDGKVLWNGDDSLQVEALNPESRIVDIYAGCYHSMAMDEKGYLYSPKNYWTSY